MKLSTNQIDIQAQISTISKNHIMHIFTWCVFAVSLRHYNFDSCFVVFFIFAKHLTYCYVMVQVIFTPVSVFFPMCALFLMVN